MGFRCKRCRAEILSQDVDAQRMIAKCRSCNTLFDAYSAPDGTKLPPSVPRPKRSEGDDGLPDHVTLDPGRRPTPAGYRVAEGVLGAPLRVTIPTMRVRKGDGMGCMLGVLIPIGGGIVLGIVTGELGGFGAVAMGAPVVALAYGLIASLVNTTTITADEKAVRITSGPMPLLRDKQVDTPDIEQLFVTGGSGRMPVLTASLRNGTSRELLRSELAEDLLFIEKVVERRLGIENRAMGVTEEIT